MNKQDLMKYSGQGIKVALIDSGVKSDHPILKRCSIRQFQKKGSSFVEVIPNDPYGHGTACAGIIHKYAQKAQIYSLQCFDTNGSSTEKHIIEALSWCIDNKINIVNLSFGALSQYESEALKTIGKRCYNAGILLLTACHDSGFLSIPAKYDSYIAVLGRTVKNRYTYYYVNDTFIANGGRQIVCWNNDSYIYADGSSFATARMTGIVAKIIDAFPDLTVNEYINLLKKYADKNDNIYLNNKTDYICESNSDSFSINNAIVYSNTKEISTMLNFQEILNFNIKAIIVPSKQRTNIYANVKTYYNLSDIDLKNIDTIIISKTSTFESIIGKDLLSNIIDWAIDNNLNIFSIEYIDKSMYPNLFEKAKKKNVLIRHPIIGEKEYSRSQLYRSLYGHIGNSTPIVGVFGTGASQGKFTVQLSLRKGLAKQGYKVCNLGSETHCELFGFEGVCPLETNSSIRFQRENIIKYIQGEMRRIEIEYKPDIIIVGGQSGIIPYSYTINDDEYTLPTISFLMATIPHCYILSANINDDISFIRDSIQALESIGKGQVIAITTSKIRYNVEHGISIIKKEKLSNDEYNEIIKEWEKEFNIPVYDVMDILDEKLLHNTIISYFTKIT